MFDEIEMMMRMMNAMMGAGNSQPPRRREPSVRVVQMPGVLVVIEDDGVDDGKVEVEFHDLTESEEEDDAPEECDEDCGEECDGECAIAPLYEQIGDLAGRVTALEQAMGMCDGAIAVETAADHDADIADVMECIRVLQDRVEGLESKASKGTKKKGE